MKEGVNETLSKMNVIRRQLKIIENKIELYIEHQERDMLMNGEELDENFVILKNILARYKLKQKVNPSIYPFQPTTDKEKYMVNNYGELFASYMNTSFDSTSLNIIILTNMISFQRKIDNKQNKC
ncbi:hypothetical protein [Rossellomorea marisflavi]|uniref:hypothetical protein n=1 Tax=Rossellomorea marisflavi TaxID=189381 RepID=UPI003F9F9FB6